MTSVTFDENLKIWKSFCKSPFFHPNLSIGEVILRSLDLNPDKIGQIGYDSGIKLTNKEIKTLTIRTVQNLQNLGLKKGDHFSFCATNTDYLAPIVIASFTIGAIIVPLDPNYKKDEIVNMFEQIQPNIIFCDNDKVDQLTVALKELNLETTIYTFNGCGNESSKSIENLFMETGFEENFSPPSIDDGTKHCAAILQTSGSTGKSKGACLSHAAILNNLFNFEPDSKGIFFGFSTIFWISGSIFMLSAIVSQYQRVITSKGYSSKLFVEIVQKYKITTVLLPPVSVANLIKYQCNPDNLASIRYLYCGGGNISPQIMTDVQTLLPNGYPCACYGLTETSLLISINLKCKQEGSVGRLCNNITAKIINENGNHCGPNEDGEICLRPLYPFLGYYNNEEATSNTIDKDGFIHTGDVGHFDKNGYLYIVSRTKEMLKHKGFQVIPTEIEDLISKHFNVVLACVVGIPDEMEIEHPAAVIVKSENSHINEDEIKNVVKEKLSEYKQLCAGVYFVDSVPQTSSGKVFKRKVKEIAMDLFQHSRKCLSCSVNV